MKPIFDATWDETPVDVTAEANFIWSIANKLRKPLGNKKNEFLPEDRAEIVNLYLDFAETELCKIYRNEEFMYREYTVMQPLQRSYAITEERINHMLQSGALSSLWDAAKVAELKAIAQPSVKEERKLQVSLASKIPMVYFEQSLFKRTICLYAEFHLRYW